jgi:hypothetical protein
MTRKCDSCRGGRRLTKKQAGFWRAAALVLGVAPLTLCSAGCTQDSSKDRSTQESELPQEPTPTSSAPKLPKPSVEKADLAAQANADAGEPVDTNSPIDSEAHAEKPAPSAPPNTGDSPNGTPAQAYSAAMDSRQTATRQARAGKLEAAYAAALKGWQAVRAHPNDPRCQSLAAELLGELEIYGERLSDAAGDVNGSGLGAKPLRFE